MSTEQQKKTILSDTKMLLTVIEILVLVIMSGYIFGVIEADLNSHGEKIEVHDSLIKNNASAIQNHEIKQAVTTEQYRQIINELRKINDKMDAQ